MFHVIESFFLKGTFMKIRKSILAAATAATVSVSGVVAAPAFAADEPAKDETVTAEDNNNQSEGNEDEGKDGDDDQDNGKQKPNPKSNSSDAAQKMFYDYNKDAEEWYISPSKITAWIGVFSTVLGLLAKAFQFAQKNLNLPKF